MFKKLLAANLLLASVMSGAVAALYYQEGVDVQTQPSGNARIYTSATPNANVGRAGVRGNVGNARGVLTVSSSIPGTKPVSGVNTNVNANQTINTGSVVTGVTPNNNGNNGNNNGGTDNDGLTNIDQCMSSLSSCVAGAFADGIRDMFDPKIREAIMLGNDIDRVALCQNVVDKCISDVKTSDGKTTFYKDSKTVWADFNRRVIQPEYYSFVMRETGLTPDQAENTCMLLDKNTYGKSFAGVAGDQVMGEYQDQIKPFNNQAAQDQKTSSLGLTPNNEYDRGYYARWDAKVAKCYVRVAAYNGDKIIDDKWARFAGTGKDAEAWVPAGDSFKCNKDLFDFALRTTTKGVALYGIGSGAIVGGITGAIIGKNTGATKGIDLNTLNCLNKSERDDLATAISNSDNGWDLLQRYNVNIKNKATLSEKDCQNILNLFGKRLVNAETAIGTDLIAKKKTASGAKKSGSTSTGARLTYNYVLGVPVTGGFATVVASDKLTSVWYAISDPNINVLTDSAFLPEKVKDTNVWKQMQKNADGSFSVSELPANQTSIWVIKGTEVSDVKAAAASQALENEEESNSDSSIKFHSLKNIKIIESATCNAVSQDCIEKSSLEKEIEEIKSLRDSINDSGETSGGKNHLAGAAIGTGIGAGAGGVVTAISAFVEGKQINCRVGDDLERVALNKSYSIPKLKDYYIKWALKLGPTDGKTTTTNVQTYAEWQTACSLQASNCAAATVKKLGTGEVIKNACVMPFASGQSSDAKCMPNPDLGMCVVSYDPCPPAKTKP